MLREPWRVRLPRDRACSIIVTGRVKEGWPMGTRGEVFSSKANTAKRTYFFNVKENRTGDIFLNVVESKKNGEDQFERRQVVVFREDLDAFLEAFQAAVQFMRKGG
jgi:hypothetical protein